MCSKAVTAPLSISAVCVGWSWTNEGDELQKMKPEFSLFFSLPTSQLSLTSLPPPILPSITTSGRASPPCSNWEAGWQWVQPVMGFCNLVAQVILESACQNSYKSPVVCIPLCRRKPLHFNSAAVSISVIQGGIIRGLFIHPRRLPGGR